MQLPGVHASDKEAIEIVAKHLPFYKAVPLVLHATLAFPPHTPVPTATRDLAPL